MGILQLLHVRHRSCCTCHASEDISKTSLIKHSAVDGRISLGLGQKHCNICVLGLYKRKNPLFNEKNLA